VQDIVLTHPMCGIRKTALHHLELKLNHLLQRDASIKSGAQAQ